MSNPEVVAAIVAAVAAVIVEVIRRGRKTDQMLNRTDQRIDKMLQEMQPNGGKSMHDRIGRIDSTVDQLRRVQVEHGERLVAVETKVSERTGRQTA